jgi:hypothetical protein
MPKCIYCGEFAGFFTDRHGACEAGERPTSTMLAAPAAPPHPVTFRMIIWGVFCGLWLYSLSAGLVYLILHFLFT